MNKAITEGLVLMPPPFSAGLNLWSREDGTPGQGSYLAQPNAAFVPSDQDFGGCLELEKTASTQKLRCFQQIPMQPGLYLQVTAKVKAVSGALPSVRIAGWAGSSSGSNVTSADQIGPTVALTTYGEIVTVRAIIGSGNRQGVDMIWGTAPVYGHLGLDLTGANGGVVRIEDIVVEDVSAIFHSVMFDWVDVRDFGAKGDGVTNDLAAFQAADAAASGKRVIVPPGNYLVSGHLTLDNPVQFEGTLTMPDNQRLACTRNYNLDTYAAAFGGELLGFTKALQALFFFTDHVELDLNGRRVELTGPIDVAVLTGLTSFAQRRVLMGGQITALTGVAWNTTTVTSVATYATSNPARLTAVANVANIPIGARISGTGVGREIYVESKNIGAGTVDLSQPLWAAAGTRTFTFSRYKYLLDFGGFTSGLSKFEISDIEFLCGGFASGINLAPSGDTFHLTNCVINRPKDRGLTSPGRGCQGLMIDNCQFLSNESGIPAEDRTTIAFNVNANDTKFRGNRCVMFAHFGIVAGTGHMFLGNHAFGGDDVPVSTRRAGLVFTTPNCMSFFTGNYLDNHFIEMSNEYDDQPDFNAQYSFGGLTITGNVFTSLGSAAWFAWIVVTPRGTGHFVNGLTVASNVFRAINGNLDRIEMADTTHAVLTYTSFRNVTFENNTFNGIAQVTVSPLLIEHIQNTAADTWVVDGGDYLPFGARARNVVSLVAEGAITNTANAAQHVMPYVQVEQGAGGKLVNLRWPSDVKGKMQVTLRCDNPV